MLPIFTYTCTYIRFLDSNLRFQDPDTSNKSLDNTRSSDMEEVNSSMRSMSVSSSSSMNDSKLITSDSEFVPSEFEKTTLTPAAPLPIPNSVSELNMTGVTEVADRFNLSYAGSAMMVNSVLEMTGWITSEAKGLVVTTE